MQDNHFSDAAGEHESYPFQFHGQTGEYFKIWIVNILLTVLTLGVFSAWAKVRNRRYFYGNTTLHGANFEYIASPVKILIARIIIVFILLGGAIWAGEDLLRNASHTLLLFLLLPWALARGFSFNARYSLHRNVPFGFKRDNKAYLTIYLIFLPLVLWASLGYYNALNLDLAFLKDTSWGGFFGNDREDRIILVFGILILLTIFFLPFLLRGFHRFKAENHRWGVMRAGFSARSIFSYMFSCWVMPLMVVIFPAMVGGIVFFLYGDQLNDLKDGLEEISDLPILGIVLVFLLSIYVLPVPLYGIMHAKLFRMYWESLVLEGGGRMRCEFSTVGFAVKIITVNFFAKLVSLGLLTPWAKIRRARYLAANMALEMPAGAMDRVLAAAKEREGAIGEEFEAAEGLGFDFGLV